MDGRCIVARNHRDVGFLVAVLLGVAGAAIASVLIGLLVRRVKTRDHTTLAIFTIGADILLTTELTRRIGADAFPIGDPWAASGVRGRAVTAARWPTIASRPARDPSRAGDAT